MILFIILFLFGVIFFIYNNNIQLKGFKTTKEKYINEILKIQQEINQKQQELKKQQQNIVTLKVETQKYKTYIQQAEEKLNSVLCESIKIQHTLEEKQKKINNYYDIMKQKANESFQQYSNTLDKCYEEKEKNFNFKISQMQVQQKQFENQLNQIKNTFQAAAAARLREQEEEDKISFYKIRLTNEQIADILKMQGWKKELYDPTIISKIIWSTYILKPTSDLCNRVLGPKTVCGIYKITNKNTEETYIGQSVNIAQRWKQHIKYGLGIDTPSTNKLYNSMLNTGVWNFTFELLQKCSRDKLNEKERFWINMYQSNKVGMNITKGNK